MWEATDGAEHAQLVKANAAELELDRSLSRVTLPRVISDTISLCRDLGERYLWVDRLCIIQDDERSKPDQINGMDRIYHSASFAIMAALDDRKGEGLPGYGDHRRMSRASLWGPDRSRNIGRGIDPNGIQTIVDVSLWNMRGWTFQERLLWKCRLFITKYQVLFECCRGQAAEELTWSRPRRDPTKKENIHAEEGDGEDSPAQQDASTDSEKEQRIPPIPGFYRRLPYRKDTTIKLRDHISLADYCHWVEDYTSRQLSHSADILKAFAGVASALRTAMRCETMFGLPDLYLPQALMWSHTGAAARREDVPWIPSWSCAAWTGAAAGYGWLFNQTRLVDIKFVRIATLVSFSYQDPAAAIGELRKLRVRERWLGSEMRISRLHRPERLPPLPRRMNGGKFNISKETERRYAEMWRACPHSPWEALEHAELDARAVAVAGNFPGALVFSTTVASLRIGLVPGARAFGAVVEHAEILDAMDADWVAGRKGKRDRRRLLDFIVISAALEDIISDRNEWAFIEGWFHDMLRFNVMLVERLPFEAFVARRVGVGYVRVSQWRECNPRWETVVLC